MLVSGKRNISPQTPPVLFQRVKDLIKEDDNVANTTISAAPLKFRRLFEGGVSHQIQRALYVR
jgi:hypothetical protein